MLCVAVVLSTGLNRPFAAPVTAFRPGDGGSWSGPRGGDDSRPSARSFGGGVESWNEPSGGVRTAVVSYIPLVCGDRRNDAALAVAGVVIGLVSKCVHASALARGWNPWGRQIQEIGAGQSLTHS
jgi:hypothetical protein